MFKLRRLSNEPILAPNPNNTWEQAAVFNCGVIVHQDRIHMFYRAADRDFAALVDEQPDQSKKFVSVFGYAVSEDGINFVRDSQPISLAKGFKKSGV